MSEDNTQIVLSAIRETETRITGELQIIRSDVSALRESVSEVRSEARGTAKHADKIEERVERIDDKVDDTNQRMTQLAEQVANQEKRIAAAEEEEKHRKRNAYGLAAGASFGGVTLVEIIKTALLNS